MTFNLLILYQNETRKKYDALAIAHYLGARGNRVGLFDVERREICYRDEHAYIRQYEIIHRLSEFDGACLRCPTEIKHSKIAADAVRDAGVPIYQDYPMLVAGGDKMLSQAIFEANGIPTPRTFGLSFAEDPRLDDLEAFIASLGDGPFVAKSNRGWSGNQVDIVDTPAEALRSFLKFHDLARQAGVGGALVQAFIESNPVRRRDYRIHTIVGLDSQGVPTGQAVAAALRLAQPGMRITNVSKGAEKIRVSLDEAEGFAFYAKRNNLKEDEFRRLVENRDIQVLPPGLKAVAIQAATAFGPGSLGLDIIVGEQDAQPKVIEVNPFAGFSASLEDEYGFSIYQPWADAFISFVKHKSAKK